MRSNQRAGGEWPRRGGAASAGLPLRAFSSRGSELLPLAPHRGSREAESVSGGREGRSARPAWLISVLLGEIPAAHDSQAPCLEGRRSEEESGTLSGATRARLMLSRVPAHLHLGPGAGGVRDRGQGWNLELPGGAEHVITSPGVPCSV